MKARILATCVSGAIGLAASSAMAAPSTWWQPYTNDAGTMALYHFDNITGTTVTDSSSNGLTATLVPAMAQSITSTVPYSGFGNALEAIVGNSGGPWATTPYNVAMNPVAIANGGNTNMTIEAWIKPTTYDATTGEVYIAGTRNSTGWNLGLVGGKLYFEGFYAGKYAGVLAPTALAADTWYHVAAVYAENSVASWEDHVKLYINGTLVQDSSYYQNANIDGTIGIGADDLVIGDKGNKDVSYAFQGPMDELRYSSVAREFAPVPEPASLSLLALGAAGLLARRRRRS